MSQQLTRPDASGRILTPAVSEANTIAIHSHHSHGFTGGFLCLHNHAFHIVSQDVLGGAERLEVVKPQWSDPQAIEFFVSFILLGSGNVNARVSTNQAMRCCLR